MNWHSQFTLSKIEFAVFKGEGQRSWGESSEPSAVYVSGLVVCDSGVCVNILCKGHLALEDDSEQHITSDASWNCGSKPLTFTAPY